MLYFAKSGMSPQEPPPSDSDPKAFCELEDKASAAALGVHASTATVGVDVFGWGSVEGLGGGVCDFG